MLEEKQNDSATDNPTVSESLFPISHGKFNEFPYGQTAKLFSGLPVIYFMSIINETDLTGKPVLLTIVFKVTSER